MEKPTYIVAILNLETGAISNQNTTNDLEWTAEQMMRNRDRKNFKVIRIIDFIQLDFH